MQTITERLRGSDLSAEDQKRALAAYVHRFTGEHKPSWTECADCLKYPVQFKDDAGWLANTTFRVTKSGRLELRAHAESRPTWPNNPELRKGGAR